MNKQKITVIATSVLIIIGFILAVFFYQRAQQTKYGFLAEENAETFVRPHSPTMGPEDAKVYLVEFLDPECEACRAFYPAVKKIMEDHKGQIRLVVRYVPFHGNSKYVIGILEASRKQNLFWETLEMVFKSQPAWGSHHNPQPQKLWGFLNAVQGLDVARLKRDMSSEEIPKVIDQDMRDSQTLGVRATPTFFVNGKKLQQFGYEPLLALIRSELSK
tara:strand:+ start:293889 stop:294539 length:651 start_codon:yes stop_codon:yes gene_type:complete